MIREEEYLHRAISDDDDDLKFKIIRMNNYLSLINYNRYFLVEVSGNGLLLEPDIRSDVYDLDRRNRLKIISVDEEVLL